MRRKLALREVAKNALISAWFKKQFEIRRFWLDFSIIIRTMKPLEKNLQGNKYFTDPDLSNKKQRTSIDN